MKLSAFWKGLIMAIVGFIATTLSDLETFSMAYVAIATVGFTAVYVAKNYVWPSTSGSGLINWGDIISGLVLALGMAISSFAASVITTGAIDWQALWIAVVGAVIGYFTKTLPSGKK